MTTMNWGDLAQAAEADKIEPIPESKYLFEIVDAKASTSAKGTGVNVRIRAKVVDGEYAGRSSFGNLFIPFPGADVKPGTFNMASNKLNAVGVPLATLKEHGRSVEESMVLFKGKRFIGEIEHREWQGDIRDGIEGFQSLDSVSDSASGAMPATSTAPTDPFG